MMWVRASVCWGGGEVGFRVSGVGFREGDPAGFKQFEVCRGGPFLRSML